MPQTSPLPPEPALERVVILRRRAGAEVQIATQPLAGAAGATPAPAAAVDEVVARHATAKLTQIPAPNGVAERLVHAPTAVERYPHRNDPAVNRYSIGSSPGSDWVPPSVVLRIAERADEGAPRLQAGSVHVLPAPNRPQRAADATPGSSSAPAMASAGTVGLDEPARLPPPASLDVVRLADQVYQILVRRLASERERRGS